MKLNIKIFILSLLFCLSCYGDDSFFVVEDLSVGYRQYFSNIPNPIIINESTPKIDFGYNGWGIPSYSVNIPLPYIFDSRDIQFNFKLRFFQNFYYQNNIDIMIKRVVYLDMDEEFPLPKMNNSFGFERKFLNIEYTRSDYLINNQYANYFYPTNDSIMIKVKFFGNKGVTHE